MTITRQFCDTNYCISHTGNSSSVFLRIQDQGVHSGARNAAVVCRSSDQKCIGMYETPVFYCSFPNVITSVFGFVCQLMRVVLITAQYRSITQIWFKSFPTAFKMSQIFPLWIYLYYGFLTSSIHL